MRFDYQNSFLSPPPMVIVHQKIYTEQYRGCGGVLAKSLEAVYFVCFLVVKIKHCSHHAKGIYRGAHVSAGAYDLPQRMRTQRR